MLVLLPGFGADEALWKDVTAPLQSTLDTQVFVLDKQKSRSEMADFVLKNTPEQFFLAGHSMGGWVAQEVAARAPKRVSKLILLNTWTRFNHEMVTTQAFFQMMIKEGKFEALQGEFISKLIPAERLADLELLGTLQQMYNRRTPEVLCQQLEAMNQDYETLPLLQKITCPTLVVHSRQDALFPIEEFQIISTQIPHAKGVVVENCGHMTPLERPNETIKLLIQGIS